jgi:hypothetical protein
VVRVRESILATVAARLDFEVQVRRMQFARTGLPFVGGAVAACEEMAEVCRSCRSVRGAWATMKLSERIAIGLELTDRTGRATGRRCAIAFGLLMLERLAPGVSSRANRGGRR